jgi:diphthine methyl ester acylhydrolase
MRPYFLDEGGDDLKMKAWDIRQGFMQPMFVNKK